MMVITNHNKIIFQLRFSTRHCFVFLINMQDQDYYVRVNPFVLLLQSEEILNKFD